MIIRKTVPPMALPVMIARRVPGDIGTDEGAERVVGIRLVNCAQVDVSDYDVKVKYSP